jgi:hypothetical protein
MFFTDVFDVSPDVLEDYGALNISLVNDLPLFIDPFLLFNSTDPDYQALHEHIIEYLSFLRDRSIQGTINDGLLEAWFTFREVKQNWLGFSLNGNGGSGLGIDFARALHASLNTIFSSFGKEKITKGTHLEKLCLIRDGVGRDNISDFTTNLIKGFLLSYTQKFAEQHIDKAHCKFWRVDKVSFNYDTQSWTTGRFFLPTHDGDFVLLTPKDLLTRDDTWINRGDLIHRFDDIAQSMPNEALRAQINDHFRRRLGKNPKEKEVRAARAETIAAFPVLIEQYIKDKEEHGNEARAASEEDVTAVETVFIDGAKELINELTQTAFYSTNGNTLDEARTRALFLKDIIENKDGYRALYYPNGDPIGRESQLQVMYRLVWIGTQSDINREVNNGRGPADFIVSRGAADKTVVEFKLAKNSRLADNLAKQTEIYQRAADAPHKLKVITYFDKHEKRRVDDILRRLNLVSDPSIVLIDASEKISASKA